MNRIKKHDRADDIIFMENKYINNREDMIELYSHAKCLVVPSVYEPFGIVNIEAMSCGTPVVGSSVGGIKDIILDNKTGYMVKPGDPALFADKINELLRNKEKQLAFGEASRKRIIREFEWKKIAEKHLRLYADVLGKIKND
jgi:alpha-maltose-1-phosphate synthase